jgi:hypothetical protein
VRLRDRLELAGAIGFCIALAALLVALWALTVGF